MNNEFTNAFGAFKIDNIDPRSVQECHKPDDVDTANTQEDFKYLRKQFAADNAAITAAEKFESGQELNDDEATYLKGIRGPRSRIPIFTNFTEKHKYFLEPMIVKDKDGKNIDNDEFIVILNAAVPYLDFYSKESHATAGMSFAHLLCIPKKRIYNAVTLTGQHIALLERMRNFLKEQFNSMIFRQNLAELVRGHVKKVMENNKNDLVERGVQKILHNKLEVDLEKLENDVTGAYIDFCFHVHPYPSIGHLHMHVLQKNMRTSYCHDWKNMPLDAVLGVLKAEGQTGGTRKRLEKCTMCELKEKAKKRKMKGYSTMKKADLIAALRRK
jgi:hypothetical protein